MEKSKKIVVDSSVIVKWLNSQNEKYLTQTDKLLLDCEKGKITLIAPELAKYEVGNALLYKEMETTLTHASLSTLYSLPIEFIPLTEEEASDSLDIARENKVTFYDAVFVNLTKKIGAVLVTDNPKHQKQIKGAKIIAIKDYQ